jgi:hypothetical protein
MEVGFAAAAQVPIFATHPPADLTLREYAKIVPSLFHAVREMSQTPRPRKTGLLIDPHASIEEAHDILERIESRLAERAQPVMSALPIYRDLEELRSAVALPILVH